MKTRSWLLLAATCLAVVGAETATAQQKSITISSWGGAFQKAQREAWFNTVEKELGITIKEETTQGIQDVRAQVASGKPTLINAVIDENAGTESGRIGNLNPQSGAKKK